MELLDTNDVVKAMPDSTMEKFLPHKGVVKPRIEVRKPPLEKSFDSKMDTTSNNNEKPRLDEASGPRKDSGYLLMIQIIGQIDQRLKSRKQFLILSL